MLIWSHVTARGKHKPIRLYGKRQGSYFTIGVIGDKQSTVEGGNGYVGSNRRLFN